MEFASLGSGSEGNATLIRQSGGSAGSVLVDCGFSARECISRLAERQVDGSDIAAILVTHEHGDHIKGVARLANRLRVPVYCSWGTWREKLDGQLDEALLRTIYPGQSFSVAGIDVQVVPVPHDAREPCQFTFSSGQWRLGLLSDLGCITPHIVEQYQACDGLMLEFNHDANMLQTGPYHPSLKKRVGGNLGHLNNEQAVALLQQVVGSNLQQLVATHISQTNNHPELVLDAILEAGLTLETSIELATQAEGFDWQQLRNSDANYEVSHSWKK